MPEPEAEGGDHRHTHSGDDRPHDPVGRHVRRSAAIEQERRHDDELGQVDGPGPGEGELSVPTSGLASTAIIARPPAGAVEVVVIAVVLAAFIAIGSGRFGGEPPR